MIEQIIRATKNWIKDEGYVKEDFHLRSIAKYKTGNVALLGMRRLGKTEYLKYRYKLLMDSLGVKKDSAFVTSDINEDLNVVFINFDDPIYSEINFNDLESKLFHQLSMSLLNIIEDPKYNIKLVLIDEIQRRKEWSRWIKGFIDRYGKKVSFVVTGSDSIEMSKSNEYGIDRFDTLYIGPLSYNEYVNMKLYFDTPNLVDYIDNHVFPSKEMNRNKAKQFDQVVEKQIYNSKADKKNILNILNIISLNPGELNTPSSVKSHLDEKSDTKIGRSEQVEDIINFLCDSKLVLKLENGFDATRTSTISKYRYYPYNWNSYMFFSQERGINSFGDIKFFNDKQKSGLIFENMIIANIFSESHTSIEQHKIQYYEDKKAAIDVDLFINRQAIEIKHFDVISATDQTTFKRLIVKNEYFKKRNCDFIVWHTGETTVYNKISFVNIEKALKGKLWIKQMD